MPLQADILLEFFDPKKFLIKITPLNPTYQATKNGLLSYIDPYKNNGMELLESLFSSEYEVILCIGEVEENLIGSNCGQNLLKHLKEKEKIKNGYTYEIVY